MKTIENFKFDIQAEDMNEITQVQQLIEEFKHIFAFSMKDIEGAKGITHHIDKSDSKPINHDTVITKIKRFSNK